MKFKLESRFKPAGGQPEAIKKLVSGYSKHARQTLLGITGSGKSLDYNEPILIVNKNDQIIKTKIGDFVEKRLISPSMVNGTMYQEISGEKIISFNPKNLMIKEKAICQVSKHKEDKIYKITLDDNSNIKLTKDHNCFRFTNCIFELCLTSSLKIGDYIPLSNCVPKPGNILKEINLLKFNQKNKVSINSLIKKYDDKSMTVALNFFKSEFRAPRWKLKQVMENTKERGITIDQLYKLLKQYSVSLKDVNDYIKIITKRDVMSPIINVTDSFFTFCGLYVAEGHNVGERIIISNSNIALQEECQKFANMHHITFARHNKNDISYYSKIICNFLREFGTHAKNKRVPSLFYNLSDEDLGTFLRAMFDGDGWVERNSLHYLSASKELISDIRNLLLRFKITSRMSLKKVKDKFFYQLNISGKENLTIFYEKIDFSIDYKTEGLFKAIKQNQNTNVDLIPNCSDFIKGIRSRFSLKQKELAKILKCNQSHISFIENNNRLPSKILFLRMIRWLIKKDPSFNYLLNLKDFNIRRIVKIEKCRSSTGWVYDLGVKNNETFMSGFGNFLVHNTFVMANIIEQLQKPTLILAHNKTLAAQLYAELKELFPENRVEYFISYYDYYQPESYLPTTDTYIEKDASVNEQIEKMRLKTMATLLARKDVIVVASISCIYGAGNPKDYASLALDVKIGKSFTRQKLIIKLIQMLYERNDKSVESGKFRVRGNVIDIFPAYDNMVVRIELEDDKVSDISEIHSVTGERIATLDEIKIFPAKQFVVPEEKQINAMSAIKEELKDRLPQLDILERERLKKRTRYDLEMMQELGYCSGIENYSRHFDGRKPGVPPYVLLDYFGDDFLFIIDESHQTLPQSHAMYKGDYARKKNLVEFGFRLPCAFDNRPLKFEEFEKYFKHMVFVSATPGKYELEHSGQVVDLIIRPTGLLDPLVDVRSIDGQIPDLIKEIHKTIAKGERILVTTLTKRMAEDLTDYLAKEEIRVRYMHSEIQTLDRIEIIRSLRAGEFDVLIGINLLREGLDLPEVSLVVMLDADKEGFLRDERSFIQTIGRASRNVNGRVILYANKMTGSMQRAIDITAKRRSEQIAYNKKHNITPITVEKSIAPKTREIKTLKYLSKHDIQKKIIETEALMKKAAEQLDFEKAIELRDILESMIRMKESKESERKYLDEKKKEKTKKNGK
jgi:excinuclease ABC B subunit